MALSFIQNKKTFNFYWASLFFSLTYWIIESIRDVFVFHRGTIFSRIFFPDSISFWMRLMIVLLIVLFGFYAQSVQNRYQTDQSRKQRKHKGMSIVWIGLIFSTLYWMLESVRDVFVYQKGGILKQIISPDPTSFWKRFLAVCILWLFSLYVQHLFNEHRRMEESLKKTNQRLKELDRLKSEFLSTVSHELRTPIAIMREGVSLCMEEKIGTLNPTQKKLLTDTQNSIDRLNRLVTDLLDLSKIEEGKLKLRKASIDICSLIKGIYDDYALQAKKKKIKLELNMPDQYIPLYADPDKITQIFNNLLNNAFQFTKENGRILITVQDINDKIVCSVSDTGIGISKEFLGKVFSKFEQIGRLDGPGYKGTGLGLAICKGLVERHGGHIEAESILGQGTTIRFTINKESFPKILVVDDDSAVVSEIESLLREERYLYSSALTGREAVQKATDELPSAIILDIGLGEMSGYEVIGMLKQDSRTAEIPILIMSAYPIDNERVSQLNHYSAIPFIQKPIVPELLQHYLKEVLVN